MVCANGVNGRPEGRSLRECSGAILSPELWFLWGSALLWLLLLDFRDIIPCHSPCVFTKLPPIELLEWISASSKSKSKTETALEQEQDSTSGLLLSLSSSQSPSVYAVLC